MLDKNNTSPEIKKLSTSAEHNTSDANILTTLDRLVTKKNTPEHNETSQVNKQKLVEIVTGKTTTIRPSDVGATMTQEEVQESQNNKTSIVQNLKEIFINAGSAIKGAFAGFSFSSVKNWVQEIFTSKNETETIISEDNHITMTPEEIEKEKVINPIIKDAETYIGGKYVWGEKNITKDGNVDCSGFVYSLFKKQGIDIPTYSVAQAESTKGKKITDKNDLQKGDLVFFVTDKKRAKKEKIPVTHVGLYVGDGDFIHAWSSKKGIQKSKMEGGNFKGEYKWGRRFA